MEGPPGKRFPENVPMIIIAPYAQKLRNGKENPKNYPFWPELIQEIEKTEHVVQVGVEGEKPLVSDFRKDLSLQELEALVSECRTWISCDSFFQHFGWHCGKPGIVLWSVSDPLIFGHPENINLLKSQEYLVTNQFLWWEDVPHNPDAFIRPEDVIKFINNQPKG
jgi:ADP-heptose:LPS heptosyltransferase